MRWLCGWVALVFVNLPCPKLSCQLMWAGLLMSCLLSGLCSVGVGCGVGVSYALALHNYMCVVELLGWVLHVVARWLKHAAWNTWAGLPQDKCGVKTCCVCVGIAVGDPNASAM